MRALAPKVQTGQLGCCLNGLRTEASADVNGCRSGRRLHQGEQCCIVKQESETPSEKQVTVCSPRTKPVCRPQHVSVIPGDLSPLWSSCRNCVQETPQLELGFREAMQLQSVPCSLDLRLSEHQTRSLGR